MLHLEQLPRSAFPVDDLSSLLASQACDLSPPHTTPVHDQHILCRTGTSDMHPPHLILPPVARFLCTVPTLMLLKLACFLKPNSFMIKFIQLLFNNNNNNNKCPIRQETRKDPE